MKSKQKKLKSKEKPHDKKNLKIPENTKTRIKMVKNEA